MRILGVDPGLAVTGIGLVEKKGTALKMLEYGCIRTSADEPMPVRLGQIYGRLMQLCDQYQPQAMAVEKLFFNKNPLSAMQVGEARGVAMLAGNNSGTPVFEYTPLQVKQAVVGYGRAEKKQVQQMVTLLLSLEKIPRPDDAADALALAICHAHSSRLQSILGQVK